VGMYVSRTLKAASGTRCDKVAHNDSFYTVPNRFRIYQLEIGSSKWSCIPGLLEPWRHVTLCSAGSMHAAFIGFKLRTRVG
jgi:hypothetical protein